MHFKRSTMNWDLFLFVNLARKGRDYTLIWDDMVRCRSARYARCAMDGTNQNETWCGNIQQDGFVVLSFHSFHSCNICTEMLFPMNWSISVRSFFSLWVILAGQIRVRQISRKNVYSFLYIFRKWEGRIG